MAKYFYKYFQIFSIFTYNRSLTMKSFQFFKICKRFDKKREKTLIQQSMRKEKLRKAVLCSVTDYFTKPFKRIINHFFILNTHLQCNFCFLKSGWRKKYQKGKLGHITSNQFHNILRVFDVLPNFPFTASEMMGDFYL